MKRISGSLTARVNVKKPLNTLTIPQMKKQNLDMKSLTMLEGTEFQKKVLEKLGELEKRIQILEHSFGIFQS